VYTRETGAVQEAQPEEREREGWKDVHLGDESRESLQQQNDEGRKREKKRAVAG
jgi:hypothetical protein